VALSIDQSVTGIATGASTVVTAALTTATLNTIVIVAANAEWLTAVGSAGTITGVTGASLTFVKRSGLTYQDTATGAGSSWNDTEVWWAFSSAAITAQTFTVTFSKPGNNNFDDSSVIAFTVTGFTGTLYQTVPWDINGSLPATAFGQTVSIPTATGVSTTATATMVIGVASTAGAGTFNVGTGYTLIASAVNTAGSNISKTGGEFQNFAAAQSGLTVACGTNLNGWTMLADALAVAGGVAAATSRAQLFVS
jgi:hypothetical protein